MRADDDGLGARIAAVEPGPEVARLVDLRLEVELGQQLAEMGPRQAPFRTPAQPLRAALV